MADNVIRGIIQIDGGPAQQALIKFEQSLGRTENAFKKLNPATNQATLALSNLGRVAQDAPFGFIGIANNLNPLLESFQRLKESSKESGGALKALGSSLLGAGGIGFALSAVTAAISFATNGFGAWTRGLTGGKSATDELSISLLTLNSRFEEGKKSLEGLNNQLDNLAKFGSITADINFGGDSAEVARLKASQASILADQKVLTAEQGLKDAKSYLDSVQKIFNSDRGKTAEQLYFSFNLKASSVPSKLIDDLSDSQKELFTNLADAEKAVESAYSKLNSEITSRDLARANIRLVNTQNQRAADKQAADDNKKYLQEQISLAQRIYSATKDIITLNLKFRPEDNDSQKFAKAQEYLKQYFDGNYLIKLKATPILDSAPPEAKDAGSTFAEYFYSGFAEYQKGLGTEDFSILDVQAFEKLSTQKDIIGNIFGVGKKNGFLTDVQQNLVATAQIASDLLVPAFEGIINAVGEGKNAFQSFFQSIGQGLKQLFAQLAGKAALAGILSAIFPLGIGGVKGFGSIFSNLLGFRAGGGGVSSGGSYIVGERGPELFTPNVNGSIIPNGRLGSYGGGSLGGQVQFVISGNNLIGVLSAAGRNQRRLV